MRYRLFGTTADVGVVSYGKDLAEAFENQAAGMFAIMVDMRGVREVLSFDVNVEAADTEGLLAAWLEELLFLSDTNGLFFRRFEVGRITGNTLRATAYGENVDPERHVIKTPVKAVTHHMLQVSRTRDGVTTRVVYDI